MAKELKDVTKAEDNYSQWYNDLVVKAGLAENSAVRGCMVIKPYGYAIWEKMHDGAGQDVQGHGAPERLFPAVHPQVLLLEGGATTSRALPRSAPW